MPQIQQTRGDHPLPRLQAPKYGITVALQGAKLHRGLNRELGVGWLLPHRLQISPARPALEISTAAHHIDKALTGELADGCEGHGEGFLGAKDELGSHPQAIAQQALGIGKGRLNQHRLAGDNDPWIHRIHHAFLQGDLADRIDQLNRQARPKLGALDRWHINAGQELTLANHFGER